MSKAVKSKKIYHLNGDVTPMQELQTEFPIIRMIYPGIKGREKYSTAFKELLFWYYSFN